MILLVLSALLVLYLLGDIFLMGRYRTETDQVPGGEESFAAGREDAGRGGSQEKNGPNLLASAGLMEPFSHYESAIRRRNIFQATPAMVREIAAPAKRPIRLGELAANLSVSGIFLDRNPQAIILDRGANQTYYVTAGQYIGDILVKTIEKGKVVLAYRDEEMDLVF